jgi:hypothetical protein
LSDEEVIFEQEELDESNEGFDDLKDRVSNQLHLTSRKPPMNINADIYNQRKYDNNSLH